MKFLKNKLNRIFQKEQSICIFQNIRELNVITFFDIINTGNHFLLDKNYDVSKEYSEQDQNLIYTQWISICDEYFISKNDDKAAMYLRRDQDEFVILNRIKLLTDCLQHIKYLMENASVLKIKIFSELLEQAIDTAKKIEPKLKIKYAKGMIGAKEACTSISRMVLSLNNKYKLKNKKKKSDKKKIPSVFETYVKIQSILGYSITPLESMSLAEFLEHEKLAIAKRKEVPNVG